MTSTTRHYNDAASQARNATDKAADVWTQRARGVTGLIPRLPQIDLIPAVQRYFDVVQLTVDINRYLTVKSVEAAGRLTSVVRDQAESAADVVRQMPASAGHVMHEQAEKAEKAEQAEQEHARQDRKAEREQARRAHDQARERYEGLTKAELSDQLAERDLPKTGNVDELTERLIEANTK